LEKLMDTSASFTVPPGHQVHVFQGGVFPGLNRTPTGVVFLQTGLGGDDQVNEIAGLLQAAEEAVRQQSALSEVKVAAIQGTLSELAAPHQPSLLRVPCLVVASFQPGSLQGWLDDAAGRQRLTRLLQHVSTARSDVPVAFRLFAVPGSREALALAAIAAELGLVLESPQQDGALFAEVQRPDAQTLVALLGRPMPAAASAQPQVPGGPAPLVRSPRLQRLLAEAAEEPSAISWSALAQELLQRHAPLLCMTEPAPNGGHSCKLASTPGDGPALAVFPDLMALHQTARAWGLAEGTYGIAAMGIRQLAPWALQMGPPVLLSGFRTREAPRFVLLRPPALRSLADGVVPAWSQS
jgi:hypothetical protein